MHSMHTQLSAKRLKALREERGLKLMDVASACGVYPSTVGHWEKRRIPQDRLPQLAAFFQVDRAYLAGWTDEREAA